MRTESGQSLPLVAMFLCLLMAGGFLLVQMGGGANTRAQAQTAADAAALAGVSGGEESAWTAARSNGAELRQFEVTATGTFVEVAIADRTAVAKARK